MNKQIKEELYAAAEPAYREFCCKLTPGASNILGVRAPHLRKMAKELAKGDWRQYLALATTDTYEETMLQGMVIGAVKGVPADILPLVTSFVPKIDNWAVCDTFCCGLRLAKKYPAEFWDFLQPYLRDTRPYHLRFGVVCSLAHFIDEDHIEQVLTQLVAIRHEEYYVRMAVAWAVSVCYIKFPSQTLPLLEDAALDHFTHNKSIQKIIESRRVDAEAKDYLRTLKKK